MYLQNAVLEPQVHFNVVIETFVNQKELLGEHFWRFEDQRSRLPDDQIWVKMQLFGAMCTLQSFWRPMCDLAILSQLAGRGIPSMHWHKILSSWERNTFACKNIFVYPLFQWMYIVPFVLIMMFANSMDPNAGQGGGGGGGGGRWNLFKFLCATVIWLHCVLLQDIQTQRKPPWSTLSNTLWVFNKYLKFTRI